MNLPNHLPAPIRTDGSNDFARDTMVRRVPETLQRIRDVNPDYPQSIHDALKRLSDEIQSGAAIHMVEPHAPDFDHWLAQWQPIKGDGWLNTGWFFAEVYLYRQIMTAIRWYETERDPFIPIKNEEYAGDALWRLLEKALSIQGDDIEERITALLHMDLWSNRIDLSFADSLKRGAENINADDLLADDGVAMTRRLLHEDGAVHFIVDNTGTELALDLALADALIQNHTPVYLHLKWHPTFVSDATVSDVWNFIERCTQHGGDIAQFAGRLLTACETGSLRLAPHPFWNSCYFLWEMPAHLTDLFKTARMVLVKGDANYRRIVGDALWSPDTPFAQVMDYFPAPIAALRTLKSDPVVGLKPGTAEKLDTIDPRWRVNGQRGVLQLKA